MTQQHRHQVGGLAGLHQNVDVAVAEHVGVHLDAQDHCRYSLGDFHSGGTHLQHPKPLAQLVHHLVGGMLTQSKPGELGE